MFREIRTSERITEQDRRREEERKRELETINRICDGRHYSESEVNESKNYFNNLFMSILEG